MISSRLFHTVIIVGASLALGATVGCSGDDGSPSPSTDSPSTDSQANEPGARADGGPNGADAGGGADGADTGTPDRGWAPTK